MASAPDAAALTDKDKKSVLHPYTNLNAHQNIGPHIITGGEGIYVYDTDNNRYIEGMAGLWCTSLGYSEQRLVDAATRQLREMPFTHTFTHRSNVPAIELCDRLAAMAPGELSRVYLVNSGSEAVDTAIKMAWYYFNAIGKPGKKKFIARQRAYHGVTVAAGSLTGLPYVQDGFDLPAIPVVHTTTPHYYRYAEPGESEEAFTNRLADTLEQQILAEDPDTIAAFIAEPVMGAGGVLVPPAGYFDKIQAVLKKYDILFIADEVICGFARTGQMWGCQTYNIAPDILTCAKQLSASYLPIGATLVTDRLYNAFADYSDQLGMFGTGNTYGGHPVPAAVAIETLNIYEETRIDQHVQARSERFAQRVSALNNHPLVGNSRSVGLIGGIEIVKDKETREQFPLSDKMAARVMNAARQHGLLVRATPGDSVAFCPPLIINDEQIDDMFDSMQAALDDIRREIT